MLFNSIPFLFFFAIVAAVYFVIPYRFRWVLLLAASYYFYMTTKPGFVVFILLSTFSTYYAGIQMGKTESQSKRKQFLLLSLLFNLGLLFLLKYYNFLMILRKFFLPISTVSIKSPPSMSFYPPLFFEGHRRVLEKVAHFPLHMVPGLSLYSNGGESRFHSEVVF